MNKVKSEKPKQSRKLIIKNHKIMSYSVVTIVNSTSFNAKGHVNYVSVFCSDDDYSVTTGATWSASSRGICLLKDISAEVTTPQGVIKAKSFHDSIGTSDSRFAIIQTGPLVFEVTKIVTLAKSELPENYTEPTLQQN